MPAQGGTRAIGRSYTVRRYLSRVWPLPWSDRQQNYIRAGRLFVELCLNLDRPFTFARPIGNEMVQAETGHRNIGLTNNLFILKFHDTHRMRWLPIVSEDEFGHPEMAAPIIRRTENRL